MAISRTRINRLNRGFSKRSASATKQHENRQNFNVLYKKVLQERRPQISKYYEIELVIDGQSGYYLQIEGNDDYIILE